MILTSFFLPSFCLLCYVYVRVVLEFFYFNHAAVVRRAVFFVVVVVFLIFLRVLNCATVYAFF